MTTETPETRPRPRRAEHRLTLALDPATQTRLALLAQANGRTPAQEATAGLMAWLKSATAVKAINGQKDQMKAQLQAERTQAETALAERLAILEAL